MKSILLIIACIGINYTGNKEMEYCTTGKGCAIAACSFSYYQRLFLFA